MTLLLWAGVALGWLLLGLLAGWAFGRAAGMGARDE